MDIFANNNMLFKKLADNAREAIFVFSKDGTVYYANQAAYEETGYSDFSQVNITEIYPMALHLSRGELDWQQGDYMQTFAYRSNMTCYPVKLACDQLDSDWGEAVVSFAINDSERYNAVRSHRKAMDEVEEATKMKNEFTANITHELRTPINGIKGMAEGLADTELNSEQAETVGIILRCCENMTKIINDILDFAKIEAGKIELEEKEFSLNKFLNDTLSFHIGKINEKGLKLIVNVSGDIPDLLIGDELRLGQILNNLFSNAIKFTSNGHIGLEVTGSTDKNLTELFFVVMDTGIGIAPEEKDKLFRSFSQVDGSITRRFGGTGLGLAITKQFVNMMGGTINVDSEKGKGSSFSFSVKLKNGGGKDRVSFPEGSFVFTKNLPVAHKVTDESLQQFGAALSPSAAPPVLEEADFEGYDGSIPSEQFIFTNPEGNEKNLEIRENLEKLLICIELGSWDKAEGFATTVKNLLGNGDHELKNKAFALLLNVRKEKYDLAVEQWESLSELIEGKDD